MIQCIVPFFNVFIQRTRKYRRKVLSACKTQIQIGDEGPYPGLVEALRDLVSAVDPHRFPPRIKARARELKSILKGVLERIKDAARRKFSGVARLLYTEIAGHGGLSIFRRLDAACVANEKSEVKMGQGSFRRGGGGPYRGARARGGAPRGRGGARREMAEIQCFNCFRMGHMRNNCPDAAADNRANDNP